MDHGKENGNYYNEAISGLGLRAVDGGNLAPPYIPKALGITVVLEALGGARFSPLTERVI